MNLIKFIYSILLLISFNTFSQEEELMAYEHDGFWQPMDTLRDKELLEKLWQDNKAPWKKW